MTKKTAKKKAKKIKGKSPVEKALCKFPIQAAPSIPSVESGKLLDLGQLEAVSSVLSESKSALNKLKMQKAETIDPIAKGLKALRDQYKAACTPFEEAKTAAKGLLAAHEAVLAKQAAKNAEKRAVRLEAKGMSEKAEDTRKSTAMSVHSEVEGVRYRKTWKAQVIAFDSVPVLSAQGAMLRPVDESALNRIAKDDVARELGIPGVEFYLDKTPY